jgi:uracil-DNA glycosylase family 4
MPRPIRERIAKQREEIALSDESHNATTTRKPTSGGYYVLGFKIETTDIDEARKQFPQSQLLIWQPLRNSDCSECVLHKQAKTVCNLGNGAVPCDGAVLGEAPGSDEDEHGTPFCGKAGMFLRRMLRETGLDWRELFFLNTVACHPPKNRPPKAKEIKTCTSLFLIKQLDLVKPKAVLVLGNTALRAITGKKGAITKVEGSIISKDGVRYVLCCHPSYVLRFKSQENRQAFKQNLVLFHDALYPRTTEKES